MSTHPWIARSPVQAHATIAIDSAAPTTQGSADPARAYAPLARPWLAHYEQGVPATVTLPELPLVQLLRGAARTYAGQTALRMVLKYLPTGLAIQSRMSYLEVDQASDRFAAGLQNMGVRKGDRVALMLPNLPQSVVAYLGVLKAGGVVVNTNPTYTPRELRHQLHDSGAETIVTLSGLYERVAQIRDATPIRNVILTDIPDTLRWPFKRLVARQARASGMMKDIAPAAGLYRYADLVRTSGLAPDIVSAPDDAILFQYSGGTTGLSKAAMLTNANLVGNVTQLDAWLSQVQHGREKVLGALPFFHVYGMTVAMLYSLATGAELIIVPDPRDTGLILQIIHRERATLYPGVPAMYIGLINHPMAREYDLRSIKACLSGGAALPVEVAQQFERLTGGRLVEGFGLTECSPVACANPIFGERRVGSIGLPIPSTEVAVVALEPDANGVYAYLPQGQAGELVIRGPQVMRGYRNQPEETAAAIDSEGWLHTGDIGMMDADGYFSIIDRKKDLIIAGGYNIVPREVEEVLFMHEKVLDASVAGVPDPRRGETVKAFVVLKAGQSAAPDEIIAFCKQHLAPYKVPRLIEFRQELPRNQSGKVLRRILVAEEQQKLAMQQVIEEIKR
jgi:long-chain acyl-CoA synthetase